VLMFGVGIACVGAAALSVGDTVTSVVAQRRRPRRSRSRSSRRVVAATPRRLIAPELRSVRMHVRGPATSRRALRTFDLRVSHPSRTSIALGLQPSAGTPDPRSCARTEQPPPPQTQAVDVVHYRLALRRGTPTVHRPIGERSKMLSSDRQVAASREPDDLPDA
jgi:hypothetical protein